MKTGFTLIELLVVVLIIGILAAIALPQYQQAVAKSRFSHLVTLAKTIHTGETVFYLATGQYTADPSQLDIELPSHTVKTSTATETTFNLTPKGGGSLTTGSISLFYDNNFAGGQVTAAASVPGVYFLHGTTPTGSWADPLIGKITCISSGNTKLDQVCRALGYTQRFTAGWYIEP